MKNMKIGIRLALGFALVLVLMIALAVVGLSSLEKFKDQIEGIAGDNMVKVALITEMRDAVRTNAIAIRNVIMFADDAEREPELRRIADQ
jgi:methyl-accepting chemotaxis protein